MFCGACGTENLDHLQFCVRCGAALAHQRTPAPGAHASGGGPPLQVPRLRSGSGGDVGPDLGLSLGAHATGGGFRPPAAQGLMTPPPVRGTPPPPGGRGGDVGPDLGLSLGAHATGGGFRSPPPGSGSGGDVGSDLSRSLGSARTGLPGGSGGGYTPGPGSGSGGAHVSDASAVGMAQGSVIADRYEVRALLGRGGMGAVYRVLDRLRGKDVALKVMLPSLMAREKAVERFLHEAELALALADPRIVRVFDVGEDRALGLRFYTMELIAGMSLREWLEEKRKLGAPLTPEEAMGLMDELLAALTIAHRSTIHRDLKPENLMIVPSEDGAQRVSLKILDFGIAKLKGAKQFTSTSMALGTAYYMAPEQQSDAANVDARADLYSVGVIFYELLTGRLPVGRFKTPSEERPALAKALDVLILKALESDPAMRPPTAEAFREELRAIREGRAGSGGGGGSKLAIAAAVLAAVLGGGFGAWKAGLLPGKPAGGSAGTSTASSASAATSAGASTTGASTAASSTGRPSSGSGAASSGGGPSTLASAGASSRPEAAAPPAPVKPRLLSLDRPAEGALLRGDISVEGRVVGPVAQVLVNGIPAVPAEDGTFKVKVMGASRVRVVGHDAKGQEVFERTVTVNLDDERPQISLKTPPRLVTSQDEIEITGTVIDANPESTISVNGALFPVDPKGAWKASRRRLDRGANTFKVTARDRAGNQSEESLTAILDRDAPLVSISAPQDGLVTSDESVVVRGDARDEVGLARVTLNGSEVRLDRSGRSFEATFALPQDGPVTLEARAIDEAGNVSAPYIVVLRRDRRPPEVRIDPLPERIAAARAWIEGEVDEDRCTVTVDGLSALVSGRRFRGSVEVDRARQVEVAATDLAGNVTRRQVQVTPAPPARPAGPPPTPTGPTVAGPGPSAGTPAGPSSGGAAEANPLGARIAPGSVEGEGGIIGTVGSLDRDFNRIVCRIAAGAKVTTGDLLDVVRGEGAVTNVGRTRVKKVDPRTGNFSLEPERGGGVDRFRPGDRVVIPRG